MRLTQAIGLEEFELVDQNGNAFDRDRLTGRWTFLTFGYSRCPDICPMTLRTLGEVLDQLAPAPSEHRLPGAVLVSVDVTRDRPDVLASHLARFDERIVALSGDPAEVARLAKSLAVHYTVGTRDALARRLVDHTALIALIDPAARLVAGFRLPYDARDIAALFREMAGWPESARP